MIKWTGIVLMAAGLLADLTILLVAIYTGVNDSLLGIYPAPAVSSNLIAPFFLGVFFLVAGIFVTTEGR